MRMGMMMQLCEGHEGVVIMIGGSGRSSLCAEHDPGGRPSWDRRDGRDCSATVTVVAAATLGHLLVADQPQLPAPHTRLRRGAPLVARRRDAAVAIHVAASQYVSLPAASGYVRARDSPVAFKVPSHVPNPRARLTTEELVGPTVRTAGDTCVQVLLTRAIHKQTRRAVWIHQFTDMLVEVAASLWFALERSHGRPSSILQARKGPDGVGFVPGQAGGLADRAEHVELTRHITQIVQLRVIQAQLATSTVKIAVDRQLARVPAAILAAHVSS